MISIEQASTEALLDLRRALRQRLELLEMDGSPVPRARAMVARVDEILDDRASGRATASAATGSRARRARRGPVPD